MSLPGSESWTTLTTEEFHFQATGRKNAVILDVSLDGGRGGKGRVKLSELTSVFWCLAVSISVNKRSQPNKRRERRISTLGRL